MKPFKTFKELSLPTPLYGALERMGFVSPTPVQAASLPAALQGKDVLGSAQTGTGKTGAFGIPTIARLYSNPGKKALILAPTRELADQIFKVMKQMSQGTKLNGALLVGGEPFFSQKRDVQDGADYFVCTPGRLIDHIDAGLTLSKVSILVLDEVDRMLDMGFAPQLEQILPHVPQARQTLLFSATLPKEILKIAGKYLNDPTRVTIGATSAPIDKVEQKSFPTTHLNKNDLLMNHLKKYSGRILIFARTQNRTDKLFNVLDRNQMGAVTLHGGRTQGQRKQALAAFRAGTHRIMVATDLAGRGIDVDDIECVINYDVPANREDYIHRIGRTGRNGKGGIALNYLTPQDQEGRGIINPLPARLAKVAPVQNDPGDPQGGWEKRGGRNRPEFHRRGAAQRYPNAQQRDRKPLATETAKSEKQTFGRGRPAKAFGKSFDHRRPFVKPSFGEKRGFGKTEFGERRSSARPPFAEKRPFGKPAFGAPRTFTKPSFGRKRFDGDKKAFGFRKRRPEEAREDAGMPNERNIFERRAAGPPREFGERENRRGPRPSFGRRVTAEGSGPGGARRPFNDNGRRVKGRREPHRN